MPIAITADGNFFAYFSSAPELYGIGKTKNEAISSLSELLYDHCNWLSLPYPDKRDLAETKERAIKKANRLFLPWEILPDKRTIAAYRQTAIQAAFSFKSMRDSFDVEPPAIRDIFARTEEEFTAILSPYRLSGLIGGTVGLADEPCTENTLCDLRRISSLLYFSAKEIVSSARKNGVPVHDPFRFFP